MTKKALVDREHGATAELLSLSEAAQLAGMPKSYLKELIDQGRLSFSLVENRGSRKQRLTRTSLIAAGLVGADPVVETTPPAGELSALIELVRDQQRRIAALEEERFALAGQLGVLLERTRTLEERRIDATSEPPRGWRRPALRRSSRQVSTSLVFARDAVDRVLSFGMGRLRPVPSITTSMPWYDVGDDGTPDR